MNRPVRKPLVSAEATQELRAGDALLLLGARGDDEEDDDGAPPPPRRKGPNLSEPSIAPVGLDLRAVAAARREEEVDPTVQVRLPRRRRALGMVVLGTLVAASVAILAAAVLRAGRAADPAAPAAAQAAAPVVAPVEPAPAPAPALPAVTAPETPAAPSTGTLRIDRPAQPGSVWFDGKRLSATSTAVSCGTHQIRVGAGRTRSIDVPCGGEVGVSR